VRAAMKVAALFLSIAVATNASAADVNTADQATLESIKGIGPELSTRILQERDKAAFKDWDDFQRRVKGLGARNAAKLAAAGLTVNGVQRRDAR
jgi:competence protein ComEA